MKGSDATFEETRFNQQAMPGWQPLLSPRWVIGGLLLIGIFFIPIGAAITHQSNQVQEVVVRYDDIPCVDTSACVVAVDITFDKDMTQPIYFYYQISNFYQNHRQYVKSRSQDQLRGVATDQSACAPLAQVGGKILFPCGLIANSYFNDTFNASYCVGSNTCLPLSISEFSDQGISWKSDREKQFLLPSNLGTPEWNAVYTRVGTGGFELPLPTDEDFIVWMRSSGLPTFRKLRYRVNKDMKQGDTLNLRIEHNFPVSPMDGTKSIVLSTSSSLGGKQDFLGSAYIAVGVLCILAAIFFALKQRFVKSPLGDMHYYMHVLKTDE